MQLLTDLKALKSFLEILDQYVAVLDQKVDKNIKSTVSNLST